MKKYFLLFAAFPVLALGQTVLPVKTAFANTIAAGAGSVTSVGLLLPAQLTITNSPVTTSGVLTGAWAVETANYIFVGPATSPAAAPTFRAMVAADLGTTLAATFGSVSSTGKIASTSPATGIGYATGAGLAVAQITDRSTGVSINAVCGTIQTDTTSLAGLAVATFTVADTSVDIGDVVVVCQRSGATNTKTIVQVTAVASHSFNISVYNGDASTAETGAIIINFAVIKAVSS